MKKITLSDITQSDFDSAAETVVSGIKAFNRKLDTREGTVLRDLLVNPEAAIEAVVSGQIDEVRKSSSLQRLKDAQDAGEEIDQDDVNAILTNFNIKPNSGTLARGTVKVVVSDGSVSYSVSEGDIFSTVDGRQFSVDHQVIASRAGTNPTGVLSNAILYQGAAGWFFLVPVTSIEVGDSGNITHGTSLEPETKVSAFVMAEAYSDFCGGSDVRPIGDMIDGIQAGMSIRGFVSKNAIEGMLRDEFDGGDHPIVAVSSVGYGNPAQIRDRHNLFGVGVGGRVDVYVRNFTDAFVSTKTLQGERFEKEDGEYGYRIIVPESLIPGACWIKSVSDPFNHLLMSGEENPDEEDVLSSLVFSARRTADVSGTWHDIDCASSPAEAFNTVWQGFEIVLDEVDPDMEDGGYSETRNFKVTAYCMPQATDIQDFMDRDDVRSISTDVVARCPIVCSVSVDAVIKYDPKRPFDGNAAAAAIRRYINGLGFVGRITRSDIVQILKNMGAVSVEMPDKDMLHGELHDAYGVRHVLSGDALDIDDVSDGDAMLTRDTVVFCAEERNVQIRMTPNM